VQGLCAVSHQALALVITSKFLEIKKGKSTYGTFVLLDASHLHPEFHSPYEMKDEEESAGHNEVIATDAPASTEHHDARHLLVLVVVLVLVVASSSPPPSSASSIQSQAGGQAELSQLRESPASLDREGSKQLTAGDDGDVGVAHRVDECTDNDNSSSRRTRCPSFSGERRASVDTAAAAVVRRRDAFLAITDEHAPTGDATLHRAARHRVIVAPYHFCSLIIMSLIMTLTSDGASVSGSTRVSLRKIINEIRHRMTEGSRQFDDGSSRLASFRDSQEIRYRRALFPFIRKDALLIWNDSLKIRDFGLVRGR